MRRLEPHRQGITEAVSLLRDGQVIGLPTETVYGLAACAGQPAAVSLVFLAKDRPAFDPLIVHVAHRTPTSAVDSVADLSRLDTVGRERFSDLAQTFWPGPLTFVLPRHSNIPDLVTAGLPTVAVRMPDHPVTQALLREFGGPLVAPSANRFGRISPTRPEHVIAELDGKVPAVLDGGPCRVGLESTIVAIGADGTVRLLRPGGVPRASLEAVVGPVEHGQGTAIEAPGQTPEHYAPGTPSQLLPSAIEDVQDWGPFAHGRPVGVLRVFGDLDPARQVLSTRGLQVVDAHSLSVGGDAAEAAQRLFATLRALDEGPAEHLLFEPAPNEDGLLLAIMDRLRRASARAVVFAGPRE